MSYTLFIATATPLYSSNSQDMLEAAMSAANAELTVKIVFAFDGCWQLTTQSGKQQNRKDINKQLALLALYDIDEIFYFMPPEAAKNSLSAISFAQTIERIDEFDSLVNQATHVMVF
ncbi:MAG: DsrE family protein [Pseudomonadota bacterium]